MSNRKDELNLRNPDGFQVRFAKVINFLASNTQVVVAGVIGLFVIAGGIFAVQYFVGSQKVDTMTELAAIESKYEDEMEASSKQRQELQDELDKLKSMQESKKEDIPAGKIQSLEEKIASIEPDHSASMPEFLKFYQEHKGDAAGQVAGIRYASLAYENGKNEEAAEILKAVHENADSAFILKVQSGLLLVSVYEDLGKFDEALKVVDSLLGSSVEDLEPRLLLTKGQILALKDDKEAALGVLDQILEKHKVSQEADKARNLKALLY